MTLHTTTGRWRLGATLACTTMLVWGMLPLALKMVLRVLDAPTIIWFRMSVSALLIGSLLGWRRRLPPLNTLTRRGRMLLLVAVGGIAANFWAFMVGLDLTTPGNAQVLSQLGPVLLALGGLVVFGERYRRLQWIGLAVLATGLGVFFSSQLRLLVTQLDRYLLGSAMIVVAAATWAAYGLAQKQLLRSLSAEGIMLCIYVGSCLVFAPLATPSRVAGIPRFEMLVLLFCAVNTIVGYGAFSNALHHVGGKGDGGSHAQLPARVAVPVIGIVSLWSLFTVVVYTMILFGGFVKLWGLDHTLTLEHYARAFGISFEDGIRWTGVAWNSFWTTMTIALIAAPLTAAVGLLTGWLISRQSFPGKTVFEFVLMMSFAIPGTVIGISYIMAFNLPPIQMTGTALILIVCFVFRNMPVGVRGSVAAMAQLDGSLDEASLTLGAGSGRTLRRVILPLLRPAIMAALVYSFVRAITSISAVIFLVSAKYNMATAYIVGLVENGQYGVAIAYSSVLILVMITVIGGFQLLVGERRLRRRPTPPAAKEIKV